METKPYEVTDRAGTHVAGRRIQDRAAPLRLTDAEAAYELQLQTIRPWPAGARVGQAARADGEGIPAIADGLVPAVTLGDPGTPGAPLADRADVPTPPSKPRSKRR